jgi:excisionase family DNA binding protein
MSEDIPQKPLYFTLGEAAKQAQVSKPTLSKAVKDGRLSAEKQPDGSYRIQPAELFRVYPQRNGSTGINFVERETGNDNRLVSGELSRLREQLALLSAERDRERQQLTDQIEDLRQRLDAEAEARLQKTAPALPGLLRLRCRFPGLVGQNCCQFPPFLALDAGRLAG